MYITGFSLSQLTGPILTGVVALWGARENFRVRRLEEQKQVDEEKKNREDERVAGIVKERGELYTENKQLRTDLRTEIERLKLEVAGYRLETADLRAQLVAAQVEAQSAKADYDREQKTNVARELEIDTLRKEIRALRERLDARPAVVAVPMAAPA